MYAQDDASLCYVPREWSDESRTRLIPAPQKPPGYIRTASALAGTAGNGLGRDDHLMILDPGYVPSWGQGYYSRPRIEIEYLGAERQAGRQTEIKIADARR